MLKLLFALVLLLLICIVNGQTCTNNRISNPNFDIYGKVCTDICCNGPGCTTTEGRNSIIPSWTISSGSIDIFANTSANNVLSFPYAISLTGDQASPGTILQNFTGSTGAMCSWTWFSSSSESSCPFRNYTASLLNSNRITIQSRNFIAANVSRSPDYSFNEILFNTTANAQYFIQFAGSPTTGNCGAYIDNVCVSCILPTPTASITPSSTNSGSRSVTSSVTASVTPSSTTSVTSSSSASVTSSSSASVTPSSTTSVTSSSSASVTSSRSASVTPSRTASVTPSSTTSVTSSRSASVTPSRTTSVTTSRSVSATSSSSASITATTSVSISNSVSVSISNSPTTSSSVTTSASTTSSVSVSPTVSVSPSPSNSFFPAQPCRSGNIGKSKERAINFVENVLFCDISPEGNTNFTSVPFNNLIVNTSALMQCQDAVSCMGTVVYRLSCQSNNTRSTCARQPSFTAATVNLVCNNQGSNTGQCNTGRSTRRATATRTSRPNTF